MLEELYSIQNGSQPERGTEEEALALSILAVREYLHNVVRTRIADQLRPKIDESDIVQQSLLDVHSKIAVFQGKSNGEAFGWLRSIVENNLCDMQRKFHLAARRQLDREVHLTQSDAFRIHDKDATTASAIVEKRERDFELLAAVALLPIDQQRLLQRRHRDGWSFSQIGNEFGISEPAARKRWSRILESLRTKLVSKSDS